MCLVGFVWFCLECENARVLKGDIAELPRVEHKSGGTTKVGNYGLKAVFL